MQEKMYKRIKY